MDRILLVLCRAPENRISHDQLQEVVQMAFDPQWRSHDRDGFRLQPFPGRSNRVCSQPVCAEISKKASVLNSDQLGHLERADLLLAIEDSLRCGIRIDEGLLLGVPQLVLLDVVGDARPSRYYVFVSLARGLSL